MPLRGLKSRRSVQAESPYDAMAQATALEEAFSRLKRVRLCMSRYIAFDVRGEVTQGQMNSVEYLDTLSRFPELNELFVLLHDVTVCPYRLFRAA